jgi:hypothetical protein
MVYVNNGWATRLRSRPEASYWVRCHGTEMSLVLELLHWLQAVAALGSIAGNVPGALKNFQQFNMMPWELANAKADLQLRLHGHLTPILVERLDDGSDPSHQHFAIDILPVFPKDRIANALFYWPETSLELALLAVAAESGWQTIRGAEIGEWCTTTVQMEVVGGYVHLTCVFEGHVGHDYRVVSQHEHTSFRQLFAQVPEWQRASQAARECRKVERQPSQK